MSRILLLFVLKYLLVAICHESNEFYDRNRSKSPRSFSIEESSYLVIEGVPSTSMKDESVKKLRMKLDCIHELVFFIRQKNIGDLTSVLREVSDPSSSKYGQYLSRGEVNSITANQFSEAAVVSFLLSNEVHKVSRSLNGEYVRGSAPIAVWERILQTKFYTYQSSQDPVNVHICDEAVRIESYRIPTKLEEHVNGVFNTVETPRRSCNGLPRGSTSLGPSSTTDLRSYDQLYTAAWTNADAIKRERDSLLPEHITDDPPRLGGHQDNTASSQPLHDETFSRTATSGQNVPVSTLLNQQTRYWGVETQLVGWLLEMAQTTTHVPVMGLGFSMQESSVSKSEIDAFSALAVKLGCMGVTMVASSLSLQAASNVDESNRGCRDGPVFPSSSPYVTSVNRLEVRGTVYKTSDGTAAADATASQSNSTEHTTHSLIHSQHVRTHKTTFKKSQEDSTRKTDYVQISNYHPMPYWQIPASSSVAASPPFLRTQLRRSLRSDSRHAEGRAYPDFTISVSMQSQDSMSEEHSEANEVEKTCQAAMAIFSNINSARKEAGVGSLGWANPILYAHSDRLFDGVTLSSGDMVSDAEVDGSDSNSVLGVGDGDCMRSLLASVTETERKKKDGEGCKREKKDGGDGEGEENDCKGKDKSDGEERNGDDGGIDENDDDVNDDKPGGNDTKPCQSKAECSYRQSDPHTLTPSVAPTVSVPHIPCAVPTVLPTVTPTFVPSFLPTVTPTFRPSFLSTVTPTFIPSFAPTVPPSDGPSVLPTGTQTLRPVVETDMPTFAPTCAPTAVPTAANSKRELSKPSIRVTTTWMPCCLSISSLLSAVCCRLSPLLIHTGCNLSASHLTDTINLPFDPFLLYFKAVENSRQQDQVMCIRD